MQVTHVVSLILHTFLSLLLVGGTSVLFSCGRTFDLRVTLQTPKPFLPLGSIGSFLLPLWMVSVRCPEVPGYQFLLDVAEPLAEESCLPLPAASSTTGAEAAWCGERGAVARM